METNWQEVSTRNFCFDYSYNSIVLPGEHKMSLLGHDSIILGLGKASALHVNLMVKLLFVYRLMLKGNTFRGRIMKADW